MVDISVHVVSRVKVSVCPVTVPDVRRTISLKIAKISWLRALQWEPTVAPERPESRSMTATTKWVSRIISWCMCRDCWVNCQSPKISSGRSERISICFLPSRRTSCSKATSTHSLPIHVPRTSTALTCSEKSTASSSLETKTYTSHAKTARACLLSLTSMDWRIW